MKKPKIGDLMFHMHHDILVERLDHPLEDRIAYIEKNKPEAERPTRLRLMRPVKGPLPPALERARAAYSNALAAFNNAWDVYSNALAAYSNALVARDSTEAACSNALVARDSTEAACSNALVARDSTEAACSKARTTYRKAMTTYEKAWAVYGKAITAAMPALRKLHAKQCPNCPWDGNTIFPEKNR